MTTWMHLCCVLSLVVPLGCTPAAESTPDILRAVGIDTEIDYLRHEYHSGPEAARGTLLSLVYDIPYFSGCGVFPPHHVINQIFAAGGSEGGMSPGASWLPFRISAATYDALGAQVEKTAPADLALQSRYVGFKYFEDASFDAIDNQIDWMSAACDIHRDRYLAGQQIGGGI